MGGARLKLLLARVYDLTLVTADERLLRGKGLRTLANSGA
jgi:predicted nucleic acid-binding protein